VIDIFDQAVDARRRSLPEVICIDEVFTNKMNKYKYACVLLDFKASKVIDVISTRHKNYLIQYFSRIPKTEKDEVKVFVMDMWDSYREAVQLSFPKAMIAIDSFHIIRTLNDVIKNIRIRTQNKYRLHKSSPEHDDMYYYVLKKFHYFLVKNYENIYDGKIRIAKYNAYWHKSEILGYLLSIDDDLKSAYRLKERYREFNLTAEYSTCNDELNELIYAFRNHKLVELRVFGKTLEKWKIEIKNSFLIFNKRRVSNGPIESTNSKIKTIIKTANGIRKFTRFRDRVMFAINKDIPIQNK
jgi:transposase